MRLRKMGFAAVAGMMVLLLAGCGEHNNFLDSIADDDSIEAKIEEAQMALDRGDCQAAIDGFTEAFNDDPGSVANRLDLAAAYACRAGFSVTELIRIAANFISSGSANSVEFDLLKLIVDNAIRVVSDTWPQDTLAAIDFLTDDGLTPIGVCDRPPFANDPDAAFNRAIISLIRATTSISTLLDTATRAVKSSELSAENADLIGDALRDADGDMDCADSLVPGNVIANTDIAQIIRELNLLANDADGDPNNDLTPSELKQFLIDQGFEVSEN